MFIENPPLSPLRKRIVMDTLAGVDIRLAKPDDAPELALLFQKFFAEAGYKDRGIEYSLEASERWLHSVISRGVCPHLVAIGVEDKAIVGVVSYDLDSTFCVRPVAVMHTIYVVPEWRLSAIGHVLVALVVDMAAKDGACAFHAPIASGMRAAQSLVNLFKHEGFDPVGVIMGRRL
jgi:L-amino acid N-acyltransferase YncA